MENSVYKTTRNILFVLVILLMLSDCFATSILFPTFKAPLIDGAKIYTHYKMGNKVICFDEDSKSLQWEINLKHMVHSIGKASANEIAVYYWGKGFLILDAADGQIKEEHFIKGHIFGASEQKQQYYYLADKTSIKCYSRENRNDIWSFDLKEPDCVLSTAKVCGKYILVFVRPSSITFSTIKSKEITIIDGQYKVLCLRTRDGSIVWQEEQKWDETGYNYGNVKVGAKLILCSTSDAVRLIDKDSGQLLRKYESDIEIDGADFWDGDNKIVICLGKFAVGRSRSIRVIDSNNFEVICEYISHGEIAQVDVIGDIAVLGALYRNVGLYLRTGKKIWTCGQRHYTFYNGLIYYGEHYYDEADENEYRALGFVIPDTGKKEILYLEIIPTGDIKDFIITGIIAPVLIILVIFFIHKKKKCRRNNVSIEAGYGKE